MDDAVHGRPWWWAVAGALVVTVLAVVATLANVQREVDRLKKGEREIDANLRAYMARGAAPHLDDDLFSPAIICSSFYDRDTVHVAAARDDDDDDAVGGCTSTRITAAGSCTVWASLLFLNPSARICVRHDGTPLETCVKTDRGRVQLQRCVSGACEWPPHACTAPDRLLLPQCWDHAVPPLATIGCHAPVPDTAGVLQSGGERRLMLTTPKTGGALVLAPHRAYGITWGMAAEEAASPYTHPPYSVPVMPVGRIPDASPNATLASRTLSASHELVDWLAAFGLVLGPVPANGPLAALAAAPFLCDRLGQVRGGATLRVHLSNAAGEWLVDGGQYAVWDRVGETLGWQPTPPSDTLHSLVYCTSALINGEMVPFQYPA